MGPLLRRGKLMPDEVRKWAGLKGLGPVFFTVSNCSAGITDGTWAASAAILRLQKILKTHSTRQKA